MDRMYKLPVGNSFALGWGATAVLRIVFLTDPEAVQWFDTQGWILWFGIAAVLLVLAKLYNWLRLSALRGERDGPLHLLQSADAPTAAPLAAGFPQSGVIWQYGICPGPLRLEGGGLRGKVPLCQRELSPGPGA